MSNNYSYGLLLSFCLCLLSPVTIVKAATHQATVDKVAGTVTDADGEPLGGVTVGSAERRLMPTASLVLPISPSLPTS